MHSLPSGSSIAIVGGGAAGIVSAYLLSRQHTVTIFEANHYLGGHTSTVVLPDGPDAGTAIDTGFIVLNDKNYPRMHEFLRQLGVATRFSDMSFSFYDVASDFQYAGTTINGLFAQRKNLLSPKFFGFLAGLCSFCLDAQKELVAGVKNETLGAYVRRKGVSQFVIDNYLLPMGAAIWSAPLDEIMEFPAESFLRFFKNHGLLSLTNRPRWQTVVEGSHSYVKAFTKAFNGEIKLNSPVKTVRRSDREVSVVLSDGSSQQFDYVVIASHADQALRLLAEPSEEERTLLSPWRYQLNQTVLHTDASLLPSLRRSWASWNYVRYRDISQDSPVSVSYWMNLLQGLKTRQDYFVTLNGTSRIAPERIIAQFDYTHPVYTQAAIDTQPKLASLNGRQRTFFCGSYFGYGFHEDAISSAVALGQECGISL
jgi:predicted NAD/FAD-binding protein